MSFTRMEKELFTEITCFADVNGLEPIRIHHPVSLGEARNIAKTFEDGTFPFPTSHTLGCFRFDVEIIHEHNFCSEPIESYYQNGKLHRNGGPAIVYGEDRYAYYVNGQLHRRDGPAIKDGKTELYYQNGQLHRMGGPAVIKDGLFAYYINGKFDFPKYHAIQSKKLNVTNYGSLQSNISFKYDIDGCITEVLCHENEHDKIQHVTTQYNTHTFVNGLLHDDGGRPAIISKSGTRIWAQYGQIHRDDGPAMVLCDGTQVFYKYGQIHRDNGPAIIFPNGEMQWWKENQLQEKYFNDGVSLHHIDHKLVSVTCNDITITSTNEGESLEKGNYVIVDGTKTSYYKNFYLHKEDGPAIKDGAYEEYYFEGDLHREDGPAQVFHDGSRTWAHYGEFHREGGLPAKVFSNGIKEYWYNGKLQLPNGPGKVAYDSKGYEIWTDEEGRFHRENDLPAKVLSSTHKEWWIHGQLSRENDQHTVEIDGTRKWYVNGVLHREHGPAIIKNDGTLMYYINGRLQNVSGPAIIKISTTA